MSEPGLPPSPPVAPGSSSKAITALVLGILGILCCGLCAPIAWYLGQQELAAIAAGTSSAAGQGLATAGKILGIIGTVLFVLTLLWVFFWGGMAVISAFAGQN